MHVKSRALLQISEADISVRQRIDSRGNILNPNIAKFVNFEGNQL